MRTRPRGLRLRIWMFVERIVVCGMGEEGCRLGDAAVVKGNWKHLMLSMMSILRQEIAPLRRGDHCLALIIYS